MKTNNKNFGKIFASELNPTVKGQYATTIKIIVIVISNISTNDSLLYFTVYKIGKTIGTSIGHKKKSKRTIIHHHSIEIQM